MWRNSTAKEIWIAIAGKIRKSYFFTTMQADSWANFDAITQEGNKYSHIYGLLREIYRSARMDRLVLREFSINRGLDRLSGMQGLQKSDIEGDVIFRDDIVMHIFCSQEKI